MKITLIRHAKVAVIQNNTIYASEMKEWIEMYNNANITSEMPSSQNDILEIINNSDVLQCSGLKRSLDSLALLGKSPDKTNILFNEAELPYAKWRGVKLSPKVWLVWFRLAWLLGYANHSESYKEAKQRAKNAAKRLIELSNKGQNVTLIGHGMMNNLIAKELLRNDWDCTQKLGNSNWSYGMFEFREKV